MKLEADGIRTIREDDMEIDSDDFDEKMQPSLKSRCFLEGSASSNLLINARVAK